MLLNNYENRIDLLIDWIVDTLPDNARVLDIGANDGSFCPQVRRIADRAACYAGVDPDAAKLAVHPFLDERYPMMLEEATDLEPNFDCVFAVYVFEHVEDAEAFMHGAARVLRPGGSLFFITPNGDHYFAMIARLLAEAKNQEQVLRLIRPGQLVDAYHYPALYRLNSPKKLRAMATDNGFSEVEFRFSEKLGEFSCYFPGPTKVFPAMWEKMVAWRQADHLLGNLMGRMIKA